MSKRAADEAVEPTEGRSRRARKAVNYGEDALADAALVPKPEQLAAAKSPKKLPVPTVLPGRQPLPTRDADGTLLFADHPEFRPNLTPKEVLQMGSFGGTYFRTIESGVTGQTHEDAWKELPADWLEGLDIPTQVASQHYSEEVNKYGVKCGGSLEMWEESGWITEIDPFGWFQWYCRFYQGRRSTDDERQIGRGNGVIGPKGRWRTNLINKILATVGSSRTLEEAMEDYAVAPVVRQLLQHWGYKITLKDLQEAQRAKK